MYLPSVDYFSGYECLRPSSSSVQWFCVAPDLAGFEDYYSADKKAVHVALADHFYSILFHIYLYQECLKFSSDLFDNPNVEYYIQSLFLHSNAMFSLLK